MVRFFTKYHKWIGLFFTFFIVMFAFSGIFLNHRKAIAEWDIPRKVLPSGYRYVNWNNGAVSGTVRLDGNRVLLYGNSGVWVADTLCKNVLPFTGGMRQGADNRNIRAVAKTSRGELFAVSPFAIYRSSVEGEQWSDAITPKIAASHAFVDVQAQGDSLLVMTRSHIHLAVYPYDVFEEIELPQPENFARKVSLFRTFWLFHSGEIFGIPGKLLVDIVGVIVIILCITRLVLFFFKIPIKRNRRRGKNSPLLRQTNRFSLKWHNRLGNLFFAALLIVFATGMFLRPPLLIPIVRKQVSPLPGSTLDSPNPWHDKLRRLRYDAPNHCWLLSTTDGFYTLSSFEEQPRKVQAAPPVSVMGVNVWEQNRHNPEEWIIGSFSGIYRWNPAQGKSSDYFTGKPVASPRSGGRPTFDDAVSGFSADFAQGEVVFDYKRGAIAAQNPFEPMPEQIREGRMSFWNFCLELHVGRLYYTFMRGFSDWFIFVSGLLALFITVSGYVVYRKKFRKRKTHGQSKDAQR